MLDCQFGGDFSPDLLLAYVRTTIIRLCPHPGPKILWSYQLSSALLRRLIHIFHPLMVNIFMFTVVASSRQHKASKRTKSLSPLAAGISKFYCKCLDSPNSECFLKLWRLFFCVCVCFCFLLDYCAAMDFLRFMLCPTKIFYICTMIYILWYVLSTLLLLVTWTDVPWWLYTNKNNVKLEEILKKNISW